VKADRAAEDKVGAARTLLTDIRSYFSHAVYAMKLVPVEPGMGLDRMACDEWYRVYYNVAWASSDKISVGDLAVGFYHEMTHLLREHFAQSRAYGVTAETDEIANHAQDAEINDDIRDDYKLAQRDAKTAGKNVPEMPAIFDTMIFAEQFGCDDGCLWMHYYDHLLSNRSKVRVLGNLSGGHGGQAPQSHTCGSGATGVKKPWELGSPEESGVEGLDDGDRFDVRRLTAEAIRDASLRGTVPGGWSEWADEILKPTPVPWDQQLDASVHAGCDTVWGHAYRTYSRPGRHNPSPESCAAPSWRKPRPLIVVVGDTSGSMDRRKLLLVRGVVTDIAQTMSARIAFVAVDADVHGEIQYIDEHGDVPLEMRGRGGTDVRVGIAWALEHIVPQPTMLVVCTDGETPWPEQDVGVPVVACIIATREVDDPPSWITRIDVDEED